MSAYKQRALVIDDESAVGEFVARCVDREGMPVTRTETYADGLKAAKEGMPYLIFLDHDLDKGRKGYDLAREIREHDDTLDFEGIRKRRIVLMTGQTRGEILERYGDAEAQEYIDLILEKPGDMGPRQLCDLIRYTLGIDSIVRRP